MKKLNLKLTGTRPLLTANGQMANPLNPYTTAYNRLKAAKPNARSRAVKENPALLDSWFAEEERLLVEAAHYYSEEAGIYMPARNILHMIYEGFFGHGGATRKGAERLSGVLQCDSAEVPMTFEGPQTPKERIDAGAYRVGLVTNHAMGGAKVRAVQAMFLEWSLSFTLLWPDLAEEPDFLGKARSLNAKVLLDSIERQGIILGLGAYRKSPAFGNFSVEVI